MIKRATPEPRIFRREFVYCLVLMLGALHFGYTFCYASPALPLIRAEFGPDIPEVLYTLFNSATAFAAIFGTFLTGLLLRWLSRRLLTFVYAVAAVGFWLLLLPLNRDIFGYGIFVRALLGISIGAFSALTPVYLVELSPEESVGFFGSLNQFSIALGFVVCPLVAVGLGWREIAIVGAAIPASLGLLIWLVPDSPASLRDVAAAEVETIFERKWIPDLVICCLLMVFQQLSGINAILTNLVDLFNTAGVSIDSNVASAICGIAQVLACAIGGLLIDALGRRIMWAVSFGASAVMTMVYALIRSKKFEGRVNSAGPIVVIFIFAFAYGIGAGPIPWFYVSERFPAAVRPAASSIVAASNWIFAFVLLQSWPSIEDGIGVSGGFWIFTGANVIASVFGAIFVINPGPQNPSDFADVYYDRMEQSS
jgi:MFS family permease